MPMPALPPRSLRDQVSVHWLPTEGHDRYGRDVAFDPSAGNAAEDLAVQLAAIAECLETGAVEYGRTIGPRVATRIEFPSKLLYKSPNAIA